MPKNRMWLLVFLVVALTASGAHALQGGGGTQEANVDVGITKAGQITTATGAVFAARIFPVNNASSVRKEIGCFVKRNLSFGGQTESWMATCVATTPLPPSATSPNQVQCITSDEHMIALAESINVDSWIQFQKVEGNADCLSLVVDNNSRFWQVPHDRAGLP
jgi:hypothetical protein